MGRRRSERKDISISLTVTVLAALAMGVTLTLGGAAVAILTGLGILKYSGPATEMSGTFETLGINVGATITQIGVGIIICLIGVGLLFTLLYLLFKRANRDLLDIYLRAPPPM
jgi:hypothetical protein